MNTKNHYNFIKNVLVVSSLFVLILSTLFFNFPNSAKAVTQDIQYTINDNGGPVVGYYNVKQNGNKVFNWNVDVSAFNGPGTMHVVTIGAYDDIAGSAGTTAHGFSVPSNGKVDYRNPPESGSFNFSYDTRYRTCGRVQIDGSFIDDSTGSDSNLFFAIVIDYGDDCVATPVNTPPVITIVGATPVTVTQGSIYTDLGATAQDQEDGNITANVVRTGSVNTNVVETYTLTYNVTDSGGLSATPVTRTVNVVPPAPTVNLTANPTNVLYGLGTTLTWVSTNATSCTASNGWSGLKALSGSEIISNLTSNQTYVITCVGVSGVASSTANVMVGPQIADISVSKIANKSIVNVGDTVTYTITVSNSGPNNATGVSVTDLLSYKLNFVSASMSVGSYSSTTGVWLVGNLTNNSSAVLTLVATVKTGTEGQTIMNSVSAVAGQQDPNSDNNLSFFSISVNNAPPTNHPPVITLIGTNPATTTVGSIFVDPGATAQDQEDGNITANVVRTGSVNTNVVGTYTLTYNVTDSGGLSATPVTRTVNVVVIDLSCIITSTTQSGWHGTYFNYSSTTSGMQLPTSDWNISYGDPLSKSAPWTQHWYDSSFARFNRIDSNLMFGDGFFPFDSAPEEITTEGGSSHDYYFGAHFSAKVIATTTGDYAYTLASDDDSWVYVDGNLVIDNSGVHGSIIKTGSINMTAGSHIVDVYFAERHVFQSNLSFEFIDHSLDIKPISNYCNHPPVITLIGTNPATTTVGSIFVDPGATAQDQEDGNITANIIASSTVNTSIAGTYTIKYNVTDSGGLHAVEVSRTVNVLENAPTPKGSIKFCIAIANNQNVLATSSLGLPSGSFILKLATSTDFATSTIQVKNWASTSFAPNTNVISGTTNDADCVTYSNLELGTYYYSQLAISGSLWNIPKYSDKYNQPINNIFDFFNYSPELFNATTTDDSLRNMNSDGQIVLTSDNKDQSANVYITFNPAPQCVLPSVTSTLTASVTVNNPFTYTITGSATSTLSVATSTLPSGLSFATSTNTISGTPTQVGTYNISLSAQNDCGLDTKVLVLSVLSGGGGGGSPTSNLSLIKTVDKTTVNPGDTITYTIKLVNNGPNDATGVSVTDLLPNKLTLVSATTTLGTYSTTTGVWTIGNLNNTASTTMIIVATINSGTEGQKITNSAVANSAQTDPDNTNNTSNVDVNVNPIVTPPTGCQTNCGGGGGGGGGNGPIVGSYGGVNGPISTSTPTSCYYLFDYLRKDFNNNPVEVKKLQVFLRDLEGFTTVQVTGVYDDQTIVALDAFQDRYKDDILTPWGHTVHTSYTYILTKKKVNEIYCKTAFPVSIQQQAEIDNYRNFLNSLKKEGIYIGGGSSNSGAVTPIATSTIKHSDDDNVNILEPLPEVGQNTNNSSSGLTTLAGVSTTTQKIASNLTANVISAGKKFANLILYFITWPFGKLSGGLFDKTSECVTGLSILGWINIILILIIIIISYLWYREYKNNKVIAKINEEIDLN